MNTSTFNRLTSLRADNDAAGLRMDAMRSRFESLRNRHENGTAPQAVSAFQLFQTPAALAERIVAALSLQPGERILEPSAGLGRILNAIEQHKPAEVVAVEMAAECAGVLFRQDRAGVVIKQRDFLTVSPDEIGLFDAIAMNPPFHMRADIRHILHARKFLKPGGRLAAVCMAGPHRVKQLKPLCATWEELPADTFAKEGTHTVTILLTINN